MLTYQHLLPQSPGLSPAPERTFEKDPQPHRAAMPAVITGVVSRVFRRRGTQVSIRTADTSTQSALTFARSAGCQTEDEFPETERVEGAVEGTPADRRTGHLTCICCPHPRHKSERASGEKTLRIPEEPHTCRSCPKCNHQETVWIVREKVDCERTSLVHSVSPEFFIANCDVLSHTDERPFGCSVCQRSFSKKRYLNAHEKLHVAEKPYACRFCPKCFSRKDSLDYHERSHTGERPFACSVCQRKFASRSHAASHELIHTGEKPFSCSVCRKKFARKSYMMFHARRHVSTALHPPVLPQILR